jgi:shikimate kinase
MTTMWMTLRDDRRADGDEKNEKSMERHILLVGMPGCGKSTMARRMSHERGVSCYEVDEMLEKKWRRSIAEFVEENGWEKFREEEFWMVKSIVNEPVGIISAGAGFFTTEEKVEFSLKHFEVLYLEVPIDELFKRLNTPEERAKRPLLSEGDLRSKLEAILAERERFYSFGSILRIKLSD